MRNDGLFGGCEGEERDDCCDAADQGRAHTTLEGITQISFQHVEGCLLGEVIAQSMVIVGEFVDDALRVVCCKDPDCFLSVELLSVAAVEIGSIVER